MSVPAIRTCHQPPACEFALRDSLWLCARDQDVNEGNRGQQEPVDEPRAACLTFDGRNDGHHDPTDEPEGNQQDEFHVDLSLEAMDRDNNSSGNWCRSRIHTLSCQMRHSGSTLDGQRLPSLPQPLGVAQAATA